jgi:hypothetical protein
MPTSDVALNGTTENELECMEEKAIKAHVKGLQNP